MAGDWLDETGIALDHDADVALGVQLTWALRAAVAAGRLRGGERLPALRDVAAALGVNHNTVRAVVARLEGEGVLETRHGAGTFVAASVVAHARQAELLEEVGRAARDAGLGSRELAAALYVGATGAAAAPPDAATRERRALRDELAVLERVLGELEAQLPAPLPRREPHATAPSRGARLLDADQLRAQRTGLVRRLAEVQQALDAADGAPDADADADAAAAATRTATPRRRRAPRPGIARA
jgi:GntR family transcriptional regulator